MTHLTLGGGPHFGGRPLALGLWAVATLVALAACTQSSPTNEEAAPERDTSAKALLDYKSGEILLPLDEYDILGTWQTTNTIEHARQIAVGECMNDRGFSFSWLASYDDAAFSPFGDRPYGIWNEEAARLYGFQGAPNPVSLARNEEAVAGGESWTDAQQDCFDNLQGQVANLFPSDEERANSIVNRLRTEAYRLAFADPQWQAAREVWWTCLREAGLTPSTGPTEWVSQEARQLPVDSDSGSADREQEIRIAYAEARCNGETRLAQTLGDLEASYQAPLIEENEAALSAEKETMADRLAFARDYIASHG